MALSGNRERDPPVSEGPCQKFAGRILFFDVSDTLFCSVVAGLYFYLMSEELKNEPKSNNLGRLCLLRKNNVRPISKSSGVLFNLKR